MSDNNIREDFAWKVRFSPNDSNGLIGRCMTTRYLRWGQNNPKTGEYDLNLSLRIASSKDHGLVTVPIRLPRYLMPQWSPDDWVRFLDNELEFIHGTIEECAVQCLSLAIIEDPERRLVVLDETEQVVVDFKGDLPNKYLPLVLGGYKIGVYRKNNNWPIWLSIQPTYDLALEEGRKIQNEAKLAKSDTAIIAVGKLSTAVNPNFVKRYGLGLIQSSKVNNGYLWVVLQSLVAGIMIGWWLKVGLAWVSK